MPSQAPGPSQGRPSPCRLSMAKLTVPRVPTQPQVLTVGCPLLTAHCETVPGEGAAARSCELLLAHPRASDASGEGSSVQPYWPPRQSSRDAQCWTAPPGRGRRQGPSRWGRYLLPPGAVCKT